MSDLFQFEDKQYVAVGIAPFKEIKRPFIYHAGFLFSLSEKYNKIIPLKEINDVGKGTSYLFSKSD